MSNSFLGVTFANQVKRPSYDAALNKATHPDGFITGCGLSYFGTTLTMDEGILLICGRMCRHTMIENWSFTDANSGFARLVLTADMTRTATKQEFDQVNPSVEYAATVDGFSQLEQSDINEGGTIYQMVVCIVSLGSGGITGIVEQAPKLNGETITTPLKSLQELDGLKKTGRYLLQADTGNNSIYGVNVSRAVIDVSMFDDSYGTMELSLVGSSFRLRRIMRFGLWGEWLCYNPPLASGVEYATTETWRGAVVYTKLIEYAPDSFADQRTLLPHGITGLHVPVSCDVLWKRTDAEKDGWRHLPQAYYDTLSWAGQVNYIGQDDIEFALGYKLLASLRASSESVLVTLKYTKE